MEQIKNHFDEEAKEFDQIIRTLIPYYEQMVKALVLSIPFDRDEEFSVIDLGCGTGTISKAIKERFSKAKITCLDFAENMISMAKTKLGNSDDIEYIVGDFNNFEFKRGYDVVVSSLALHHLVTDDDKRGFYQKISAGLNSGGLFFNADVVLASNEHLQTVYMKRWIEFMRKSVSQEEIDNKWLPAYREEDRPTELVKQLKWLEEIGFADIDVIWKYYNFTVYGAYKR